MPGANDAVVASSSIGLVGVRAGRGSSVTIGWAVFSAVLAVAVAVGGGAVVEATGCGVGGIVAEGAGVTEGDGVAVAVGGGGGVIVGGGNSGAGSCGGGPPSRAWMR